MKRRLLSVVLTVAVLCPCVGQGLGAEATPYTDKNGYFEAVPPAGWVKKEFDDPRSKVSFDVPAPVRGQSKAGLFFLSHPLSGEVDVKAEAENRVARLRQMGSPDAKSTTVDFAGVKAERIEGQLTQQNMQLKAFMFVNYGRSYTVQFSATKQDFAEYWPIAEKSLQTFKCLPPKGSEATTEADAAKIEQEKIRVWIIALREPDLGADAINSLFNTGKAAIPQLEETTRSGTLLQKQRASELLTRIRERRD